MKKANGNLNPGNYRPEQVRIGQGGLGLHLEEADDGMIIMGNDTGPGPWVLRPGKTVWDNPMKAGAGLAYDDIQLVGADSAGAEALLGCAGVSVSATDSNRAAVICMRWVFTTNNLQAANPTWTKTSLNCGWNANGPFKAYTRKIQIDPNNPDTIYCVKQGDGLYRSIDFGATWTKVSAVPAPTGSGILILCLWRAGALSGGRSGTIACLSEGNGVYVSTDGGATFALASGANMPTVGGAMSYTAGGKLLVANTSGANISRLNAGAWTVIAHAAWSVVCHPTDATKVWSQFNGELAYSSDEGATFGTKTGIPVRNGGNIPWLAWTNEDSMGLGEAIWSNRYSGIAFTQGIGTWKTTSFPTTANPTQGSVTWTAICDGIESMVTNQIRIEPTSGDVLFGMHDRIGMQFSRTNLTKAYAADHYKIRPFAASGPEDWGTVIIHGTGAHWALDDPNWRAVQAAGRTFYTTDKFATPPVRTATNSGAGNAGDLVVRNKGEIFIVDPITKRPRYTLNSGATWQPCDFGTDANTYMGNVGNYNVYNLNRQVFARDDTTGDIYFHCVGGTAGTPEDIHCSGVWRLPAGQTTWVRQRTKLITEDANNAFGVKYSHNAAYGLDFWHCRLRAVPGKSGHLFWTTDAGQGPEGTQLMFSSDGGVSWTAVGNASSSLAANPMLCSHDVAFGVTLPGRTYPTIFVSCDIFRLGAKATAEGLSQKQRPSLFMIQDFNPANPGAATVEPIALDGGLLHPNGAFAEILAIAAWQDSADLVVTFGNCGAMCLRYEDKASAT